MAQTIIVDTTPGYRMPTIYYSQGDIGRTFSIDLQSRFGESLPASPTITIQATKPSGLGFSVASTSISGAVVTFTVTETMSNEAGRFPAELKIVKNSVTLFTANFYIDCEANAHPEGTTDGDIDHIMPKFMSVTTTTLPAGDSATYSFDADTNTATFGIPKGADGSLASQVLAADYSSSKTYAVGDYVYYSGNLYRCTTAITTAEAWTSGHWTQVALANDVSDVKSAINYIADDIIGVSFIPKSGSVNAPSVAYQETAVILGIELKSGNTYSIQLETSSAASVKVYGYLRDSSNNALKTFNIEVGDSSITALYTADSDYNNVSITFSCAVLGSVVVSASINQEDSANPIADMTAKLNYVVTRKTQLADLDFVNTENIKFRKYYGDTIGQAWCAPATGTGRNLSFYLTYNGNHLQIPGVRGDTIHIKASNCRGLINPTFIAWDALQIREMDSEGNYLTSPTRAGDGNGNYDVVYTLNNTNTVKFEIQMIVGSTSAYSVTSGYYEQFICDFFEIYFEELTIQATNQEVKNARTGFNNLNDRLNNADVRHDGITTNPYLHAPHHAHLGIDKINSIDNPAIIPSQSVWDIEASARLGFKVIEGNVHATATSGKYVVMHGASSDQIGNEIMDGNGDSPSTVKFSEIAYDSLRSDYVYRSPFEKYRTPITSLEEFCLACRKYNITPLLQYPSTGGETMVEIVKSLLGNNWILYGGSRTLFNGVMMRYVGDATTVSALETLCDTFKPPFVVCIGTPSGRYTDAQILDLIEAVHNKDCLIIFDKCYQTPAYGHHLMSLGFDGDASAWDVNDVNGNLMVVDGDVDYSGFTTTATASGYNLEFGVGDTIEIDSSSIFLGKGMLDVRFDGAFDIAMGRYANFNLESDGSSYERISTYFINEKPVFTLTATEQTTLYGIIYKADRC